MSTREPGELEMFAHRGFCSVLNVGDGDTKLSFDPKNPDDRARAAKVVTEMLRLGFAVMVEVEKDVYRRVHAFDEATCEYVIFGGGDANEQPSTAAAGKVESPQPDEAAPAKRSRVKPAKPALRLPAGSTRAVGIGRTAGG